jgi:hypothetical protein
LTVSPPERSEHRPWLKSVLRSLATTRPPTLKRIVGHDPDSDDTMPDNEIGTGDGLGEGDGDGDGDGVGVGVGVGDGAGGGVVAAASCVTVYVRPATVTVPVRAVPGFAATATATRPDAEPLVCPESDSQLAEVVAVHWHPESVDTSNPTVPPPAATESPDRLSE